jgi:hypothetical protein
VQVTITPGVGNVALTGSATVSPAVTTNYTLTATASSGSWVSRTIEALVNPGAPAVTTVYDFLSRAPYAIWQSGAGVLPFPGALSDNRGFALLRNNQKLEDNQIYAQILETHPQWVDNGFIEGSYTELFNTLNYTIQAGERFYAKIGFDNGANVGNVKFTVYLRPEGMASVKIVDVLKTYSGDLRTVEVPLGAWVGKKADFILKVDANGSSGQDWAVWAVARIIR